MVSCRQLSKFFNTAIPATKEGSYRAANAWWEQNAAGLALAVPEPPHPYAGTIDQLKRQKDWAIRHDQPDLAAEVADRIHVVTRMPDDEDQAGLPEEPFMTNGKLIQANIAAARLFGISVPNDLDPYVQNQYFGDAKVWRERFARDNDSEPVPVDRTIEALVTRYLAGQLSRYQTGDISVSEFSNCRAALLHFRDWLGADIGVEIIDADKWDAYYLYLIGPNGPNSIISRRKYFRYAKNFLTWLDDLEIHRKPKNTDRRLYRCTPASARAGGGGKSSMGEFQILW
jgi:hypothetical protein